MSKLKNNMHEKSHFFSISIGVLVVIAAIFIYLNYSKKYGSGGPPENNSINNTAPPSAEKIQFSTSKGSISVSPKGPAPEDAQQFSDRINALAEDTSEITVGGCKANPSIVRIKKSGTMAFRNGDHGEAIVVFNDKQVKISSRGAEKVAMDFLTPGIHGFGCSAAESTVVGFILITE